MNFDFALLLVVLTGVSGAIWAIDAIAFAPKRRRREKSEASGSALAPQREQLPVLVDYARSFFPIFLIVLLLRSFLVEPFRIPSGSMMPTLLEGDFILVNKYLYGIRLPVLNTKVLPVAAPERGDVVVFRYPRDPSTPFIKRVVGLPGDRVRYSDKDLFINNEKVPVEDNGPFIGTLSAARYTGALLKTEDLETVEHHILHDPRRASQRVEMTIPEGHYFVLGDNRDNSRDSRFWGTVPDENLIGKAFMIWMFWSGGPEISRIGTKIQ